MFVLLSAATPSRLLDAFPPGARVSRVPLDEAIARVRRRLSCPIEEAHEDTESAEAR